MQDVVNIATLIAAIASIATIIMIWFQTRTLKKLENYDYNILCDWIIEQCAKENIKRVESDEKINGQITLLDLYNKIPKSFKCKEKSTFLKAISQLDRENIIQKSINQNMPNEDPNDREFYLKLWQVGFNFKNTNKNQIPEELKKITKELQHIKQKLNQNHVQDH